MKLPSDIKKTKKLTKHSVISLKTNSLKQHETPIILSPKFGSEKLSQAFVSKDQQSQLSNIIASIKIKKKQAIETARIQK